ncbi:MAG: NrsF family protein, partial [Pseudomonadales bacterium]
MKTDELINMLANHAPPVDRQIVTRRFGTALAIGLALALLVLLTGFGIRPDIGQVAATPLFWAKL